MPHTPVLSPDGKIANVEGSLRQYVLDSLAVDPVTTAKPFLPTQVDLGGGEPFSDETLAEWLQVRLLEPARPRTGIGPAASVVLLGREMFHLINLNVFVRPAKLATANSLRLQTLSDRARAVFLPNVRIAVKDYAGDSVTIGHLIVDDLERDGPVSLPVRENELLQWNIVASLRWTETWTS